MFSKQLHWIIAVSIISMIAQTDVFARPPQKPNIGLFKRLSDNSPFTIKPAKAVEVKDNPLERDWTLAGISPSGEGFSVTLMNKKDRNNRIRFIPGFDTGEYKLLEVKQDVESRSNSKVYVQKGSQKAWIGYDEAALKIRPNKNVTQKKPVTNNRPTPTTQTPPGVTKAQDENAPPVPIRRVRRVPIQKTPAK